MAERSTTTIVLAVTMVLAAGCREKIQTTPVAVSPAPAKSKNTVPNLVVLPSKFDGKSELPVLVTLHGMGGKPTSFLGDDLQDIADELNIVVVAVAAPLPDEDGLAWSDVIDENLESVRQALDEASRKVKLRKDRVVLLGYSQGAYAALGLAYAHPEIFAGAIAISPGSLTNPRLPSQPSRLLAKRAFVLCHGGKDDAEYIRQGKERLDAARLAGAKTETKTYPNAAHLIPPDLDELLPKWLEFIARANED